MHWQLAVISGQKVTKNSLLRFILVIFYPAKFHWHLLCKILLKRRGRRVAIFAVNGDDTTSLQFKVL